MASINGRRGVAKNAPMSVEPNEHPDIQHVADLKTFLDGKEHITVKAGREPVALLGHAPGDDMSAPAYKVAIPPGGVARIKKQGDKEYFQPAMVLADWIARGRFEVVNDKEFTKAKDHKALWREWNDAEIKAQSALMSPHPEHGTLIAGLMEQNRALAERVAALEPAKAA